VFGCTPSMRAAFVTDKVASVGLGGRLVVTGWGQYL
jgi:hypothetical protein